MSNIPSYSIVIPARNEEAYISRCLDSVHAARQLISAEIEIIVVLNRSEDRTEEIALAAGCKIVKEDSKNLSKIRNAGVRAAGASRVITVDADSEVSRNMLQRIDSVLSSPNVVGGGVLIIPERWSLGILITGLYLLPIALWYRISCGLFFFHRRDFDEIGGFDENLLSAEDIDFARRLKSFGRKSGRRFANLLRAHIKTSCRKFDTFGDWYFVLRPILVWRLLRGEDARDANRVWYDFKH